MDLQQCTNEAMRQGFDDGVFKRPMSNPYSPYTNNWHGYNAAYLDGHSRNLCTDNLRGDVA